MRFGKPDYKDRKMNIAHDPRWPHRGRVLFTYHNFLSEEVHFNDPTKGYSITEKYTVRIPANISTTSEH